MSHQFKPGDLALVIFSRSPERIGRSVEVVEVMRDDHAQYEVGGITYRGNADGAPLAVVDFGNDLRLWEQRHLMPLRGDFAPEQQKAKETEPCA